MRWLSPHVLIAAASTGAVVTIAVVDADRTSPGALATVHGRVSDLARDGCSECHGGWFATSMTDSCNECHEVIAAQIEAGAGLHGALGERVGACAECHSEHHGAGFAIVNARSFALAGVPDVQAFEHELVGFPMDGKHLELECTECHENAELQPLPEDAHRFLGLTKSCLSCHEDPHEDQLGRDCTACHVQTSFDEHQRVGHEEHLALVGGHAGLACRTCHAADTPYSLEASLRQGRRPAPRACLDCHASPHGQRFLFANARAANVEAQSSCVVCHREDHGSFRDEALVGDPAEDDPGAPIELTLRQHAASGFPLTGPHAEVACADCHRPSANFVERFPGRGPDDCAACHVDPHAGQFDESPLAGRGCLSCHDRHAFEPHGFDEEAHARATLALTGAHLELDCEACHELADDVRVFRGTPSTCDGCHLDAHRGAFDEHAAELVELEELARAHGACATCHDAEAFDHASDDFEHGRWTAFPLAGAHAQAECAACHRERPSPDRAGRTFGRIEHVFGPYHDCSTCHADPHAGRFDPPHHARVIGGQASCARCHEESSFRAFSDAFDHGRWTDFPLAGAHADASCTACHAPLARPDESGRTWAEARGTRCADCHADPHAGQFDQRGATDCARCHESTRSFARLVFDHDRDARFELGENHAGVACKACHKPFQHAGFEIVRYRPLGRECSDCHGVDQNVLRRRKRGSR